MVAALVLVTAAVVYHLARGARASNSLSLLNDSLGVVRSAADSCRLALEGETNRLAAYDDRLDSLRGRVQELETIDPRGVPADSYPTYLGAFDAYNDSVPGWRLRADTLRAHWTRCRALAETHNVLLDSLQRAVTRRLRDAQQ